MSTYYVESFLEEKKGAILVKWQGYDNPDDNTWEPKKNLREDLGMTVYSTLISNMVTRGLPKAQGTNPPSEK